MKTNLYEYAWVEHRPMSEGGPHFFASEVEGLEKKPELWEKESPYSFDDGRVVKADDRCALIW